MAEDLELGARKYYELLSQGMSANEAFAIAFPNGIPTKKQQQEQAAKDAQKAGYGQVVGGLAGTLGSYYAIDAIRDGWKATPEANPVPTTDAPKAGAPTQGGISETNNPLNGQAGDAPVPVKQTPDGGTEFSDGAVVKSDGSVWRGGVQIVGGAAQAYNGYQQFQDGQKIGGAGNMLGGAYNTYAGYQALTGGAAPAWGAYVAPAVAAAQIGQQIANTEGNSEDRAAASQAEAQKAMLLAIPGYGWAAYAALAAGDALTGGEFTEQWARGNKNLDKFNDRIDFGLGKAIRSKLFHQSTRGVQKEHTGQLLQQSDDPTWQNYVKGMRAQHQEGPPDPSKPFHAGRYASWDEYKAAGLDASDLTGVYGNLDAFKPDWAEKAGMPDWTKLTFDQQRAVAQKLIDNDLYASKKGEVVVTDKDKARQIYSEMAANGFPTLGDPMMQRPNQPQVVGSSLVQALSGARPTYQGAQPGALPMGAGRPQGLPQQAMSNQMQQFQNLPMQISPEQMSMMAAQQSLRATPFFRAPQQASPQVNQAMQGIAGQFAPQQLQPGQMGMLQQGVQGAFSQAQGSPQAQALQVARSSTRSPGIAMDGSLIPRSTFRDDEVGSALVRALSGARRR